MLLHIPELLLLLVHLQLLVLLLVHHFFFVFTAGLEAKDLLVVDLVRRCLEEAEFGPRGSHLAMAKADFTNCAQRFALLDLASYLPQDV